MKKKKIVVLTGAGISAESGIQTFRDADGLWEGHDVMEVASPQGWNKNQELVLNFYNQRRAQLHTVKPNEAHKALAELEQKYEVCIITQNVDDLHERGGSSRVVHLHGELKKVRSTLDENLVYDWEKDVRLGDKCDKGGQLRPHIVWFGEAVPLIEVATQICGIADIFIIVGTSMQVYPAAGLVNFVDDEVPKYFIDPNPAAVNVPNLRVIADKASTGVRNLVNELMQ
ncbi:MULTISPECIES: NAD-dependent deacylase [unclassified Aureispira]|uniref:SIR2 family NAD-dependent protein deacylase n=1 Tax=unclassified Aureispira TaxID=2649989 RepID=UPI000695C07B|nr:MULTISPECIES: NAD-dependent deacylase [unclassified Aureispira]WMX15870.1 NAD-dependent deacylase [Aureispira sp. CCB-E]